MIQLGKTELEVGEGKHLEHLGAFGDTWEHLVGAFGDTHKPEPISPSLTPSDFDAVYLWDVFSFFGKTI